MDEEAKKRILMNDEVKTEVLFAAHIGFGEQMGGAVASTNLQGWYSGPLVKEEKRDAYAKEMGDSATWGLKFAKLDSFSEEFVCKMPLEKALEHIINLIPEMPGGGYNKHKGGQVLETASGSGEGALAAVVGSGWSNMNFAVVTMLFSVVDANSTKISITTAAKESKVPFCNQKTAKKAVARIISSFAG